jgi:hypothetical protein
MFSAFEPEPEAKIAILAVIISVFLLLTYFIYVQKSVFFLPEVR